MPQPSVSGMEPPFGDAFQNYSFVDQALTSTELLATSSDPDFMYELDRDMSHRQSPCGDNLSALDGGKEAEGPVDQLMALGESESVCSGSAFEQWDSYWEDLTRYTRLTSCDIWGTKEVDFLGLDDFSSPYQDEEVISRTPTLAQLNSEDSQPVCETLCPPTDLSLPPLQPPPPVFQLPAPKKRPPVSGQGPGAVRHAPARLSHSLLPDVPEGPQRPTRPVASSTDTMSKTQVQIKPDPEPTQAKQLGRGAKAAPVNTDFVRKAKVRVSSGPKTDVTSKTPFEKPDPVLSRDEKASTSSSSTSMGPPSVSVSGGFERHSEGTVRSSVPLLVEPSPTLDGPLPGLVVSGNSAPGTGTVLVVEGSEKSKEEEHNYSLFLTRSRLSQRGLTPDEDEEDDEEEEEEEVEEEEEGLDDEDHDEDHDEGFGSDHELLSENEEEDDDDDYEADKDDDMSDAFSEPGCDVEMEDIKGLTAGVPSRKRGKRRYFWEYSEQLTPSKQERMLKPSEWDRHTLPSNLYQKNGPLHGKYMLKKSRRTDVEDLTPNPRKLLQIGTELRKLNKVISDLTPVVNCPSTHVPGHAKKRTS
ncbi:hypothetical protein NQD34_010200 [Periophthalmus magnuspinnatus]|nr:hypothetical protein NQD34_010200 [Periophthalmus magnuspinnatus]